jgi:hypothetical protein
MDSEVVKYVLKSVSKQLRNRNLQGLDIRCNERVLG